MNTSIIPHNDSDDNQTFVYHFDDYPIRGVMRNGDPLFVGADVCVACGITNASNAIGRLDDDEKDGIRLADSIGRMQYTPAVTESGLYNLILRSDKPQAKAFKRYVTHELLPSIRKTGQYVTAPLSPLDILDNMVQQLRAQDAEMRQLQAITADTAVKVQDIESRLDDADYFTVAQYCAMQRIICTPALASYFGKRSVQLSHERGIELVPTPSDKYGSVNRYHRSVLIDACIPKPKVSARQLKLTGGR